MKKLIYLTVAMASLMLFGCDTNNSNEPMHTNSFAEVEELFLEPGAEFRSAPLWTWNTTVTREDIDRMMGDFKEHGFGGAYIHPRPGMETVYLSDDWFDLWGYSLEKAEELGLKMWIYDENSYPSGFAGGHVQTDFPESWNHFTELRPTIVEQLPEDLSAYCVCLKQEGDKFVDITSQPRTDEKGRYFLYEGKIPEVRRWLGYFPYVDLLYKGTTEKFLEVTMSGYEKHFKKEFGKGIRGVFTDEPQWEIWTPDMFEEFEKDWGYSLRTHLPMLKEEIGNWKQVRYHFLSTKTRLSIERWCKPWYEYCTNNNLIWTGHYLEHMWPDRIRVAGADIMAMYEWHHQPGIDLLFNQYNDKSPGAHWGNVRVVKELRSAANQVGQKRTLCESYGGGGWDMTFEDFKRMLDWEYALGVNHMNQHFSNVTIEGVRKFDYPDFFTRYSPWASNYKLINDHTARLSLVLSCGEQMNDILVLGPHSTVWMYYTHRYNQPMVEEIAQNFQTFITNLNRAQVEFDLGSETIIRNRGSVKDGKFVVGNRAYTTVIIPEMCENLFPSTVALLNDFVAQGGKLVALSQPQLADGKECETLAELWKKENIVREAKIENLQNDHICFAGVEGGDLQHMRREYDEGELLFLANSSLETAVKGSVTLCGAGLKVLDTFTGEIFRDDNAVVKDGKVTLDFNIAPAGHILVFAPKDAASLEKLPALEVIDTKKMKAAAPTSDMKVRRMSDNYLSLLFCDITVDDKTTKDLFVGDACRELFKQFDMDNPWERRVQYKDNIISTDTLTRGDITVTYRFNIAEKFDWSETKLVSEKPSIWEVKINGNTVQPKEGEHPLDARTGCYYIGDYLKVGENVVTLHRSPMSIYAEVTFAFIAGEFSVVPDKLGWQIAAPRELKMGAWRDNGAPFYSWDVAYNRNYDLPAEGRKVLQLGEWEGTVAEVWVNGEKQGVVFTQPYELDITDAVKEGENNIEVRCTGSLYNLYGPHFKNSRGRVRPNFWYMNSKPTEPENYFFIEYGLKEDFRVLIEQ